jgi:hypothetical protein
MSSRFTIDTNILRIRDVFAYNPKNADFIQPASVPVMGLNGMLLWKSSLEFLSSISVPSFSTNILGILELIQPGLSSLSTAQALNLASTVAGLGSSGYVSTSGLNFRIDHLSVDHGYISSTTLFDCFNYLADMKYITGNTTPGHLTGFGPMGMFPPGEGKLYSARGYVSTLNPGEYRIYRSTIGLSPSDNLVNNLITNTSNLTSAIIDIGGYTQHFVNSSKMRIDINANLTLALTGGGNYATTISSFLVSGGNQVGTPVRLTYSNANVSMTNLSFLLNQDQLTPGLTSLELHHVMSNVGGLTGTMNTFIPEIGGVHVTLDNTD